MKTSGIVISTAIITAFSLSGYIAGFTFGRKQGIEQGIEVGRTQEINTIKKNLWERSLDTYSRNLDDSTLVIIRQKMHPSDRAELRVRMKEAKNTEGHIVQNERGLVVKDIHWSGRISIAGSYYYSIWQLKNTTDKPVNIDNTDFVNLPAGYDINNRFHQDPIIVNPSEQAAPSNH